MNIQPNETGSTDPSGGAPALLNYIQAQQDRARRLDAVLRALREIDQGRLDPKVQAELIGAAYEMAHEINIALDAVNLPIGEVNA